LSHVTHAVHVQPLVGATINHQYRESGLLSLLQN
jgi:hypothetical protein